MTRKFISIGTTVLLLMQLFVIGGEQWWFFELFTHYPHYYALLASFLFLLALIERRFALALLLTLLISLNLATLAPYLTRTSPSSSEGDLKVLANNFLFTNDRFEELEALLTEESPDIFVIHEAGPIWKIALPIFQTDYPYFYITQETGIHGIALGSKLLGSFQEIPLGNKFGLEFLPDDHSFRLLAVHPQAPLTSDWAKERNAQFEDILNYATATSLPTLIIGDFNSTPWSPYFQKLLIDSGLKEARLGFGLVSTWHAHNFLFRLPIDHALVSGFEVLNFYKTRALSSDHWPIVVELKSTP